MSDIEAKIAELEARLARLEARNAIAELVTAYAVACDQHDMPRLTDLFTEDACFASPSGVMDAQGRDAIAAMFVELFKIRGPAFHWTHDLCIDTDSADPNRASGVIYSHAETTPNGIVSLAAMRYADDYRCEDGHWRFARREISFLYYVPAADYTSGLNQTERFTFGDQRVAADYPESLASWRAFAARYS